MADKQPRIELPKLDWKTTTCVVCGQAFDYLGRRRPATCQHGKCKYIHHFKISPKTWANSQINMFESADRD